MNAIDLVQAEPDECGWRWRYGAVSKLRLPRTLRATPQWAVHELLYHATQDETLDTVFVICLEYGVGGIGTVRVSSPGQGRRIVRLLFQWRDIEPYLGLPAKELDTILARMVTPGGLLRARTRYIRAEPGR